MRRPTAMPRNGGERAGPHRGDGGDAGVDGRQRAPRSVHIIGAAETSHPPAANGPRRQTSQAARNGDLGWVGSVQRAKRQIDGINVTKSAGLSPNASTNELRLSSERTSESTFSRPPPKLNVS